MIPFPASGIAWPRDVVCVYFNDGFCVVTYDRLGDRTRPSTEYAISYAMLGIREGVVLPALETILVRQ